MTKPKYPRGLGTAGKKLWAHLTEICELELHEEMQLLQACRVADRLDAMAQELEDQPQTVRNFKGDMVTHPLVVESRQQSLVFQRLIAGLRIPNEEDKRPQQRGGSRGAYQPRPLRAV